jgi:murein DD-endopeptidase MepM/ murein hydrolase activator NlpD
VPVATPPVSTLIPTPEPPVSEPTTVYVAPERNTPVATVDTLATPVATPIREGQPPQTGPNPVAPVSPGPGQAQGTPPGTGSTGSTAPSAVPSDVSLPPAPTDGTSGFDVTTEPTSAQAPAQLTCSPKHHPIASPFLSSPYAGWTELVSFVDHDRPDYSVDGTIVLANGLTAQASDGQASDLFPAYWSPTLRQYVNYDGHNGYDFDISYQPVLAAAGGTVEYAGWNDPNPYVGYGQMILINHHNGYVTLYGHLSKLEVATGDKVTAGQEIGISGTTGHSSGPHLHFSVFHDCQVADPYGWTGHGKDPLQTFTSSAGSYLWLPGEDPLLLNPPPNWPAYPSGLRLTLNSGRSLGGRVRPGDAIDRLLLLALPSANSETRLDTATALARTDAAITAEAENLTPSLGKLEARGLITGYQLIPSAAAVWVRGTASSEQLEALPGVASLAGVQPHDVSAAEVGLAHAVLAQVGRQQAPALWPSGFRSGLHTWRPVATVLLNRPFVAGLALPGKRVIVSLERRGEVPAAAITTADASSGGFVAFLHDPSGNPSAVEAGDTIRVTCDGHTTELSVRAGTLAARLSSIRGTSLPGATTAVSMLGADGLGDSAVFTADASGAFAAPRRTLPAGTQVVAAFRDSAGNEEGVYSFVPGLDVRERSSVVRGWAVGHAPRLILQRGGRRLIDDRIAPAEDGSFALVLGASAHPITVQPGDEIIIGSRLHHRTVRIPALALAFAGAGRVSVTGPEGRTAIVSLTTADGQDQQRRTVLGSAGRTTVSFPVRAFAPGDRISARVVTTTGDLVTAIRILHGRRSA